MIRKKLNIILATLALLLGIHTTVYSELLSTVNIRNFGACFGQLCAEGDIFRITLISPESPFQSYDIFDLDTSQLETGSLFVADENTNTEFSNVVTFLTNGINDRLQSSLADSVSGGSASVSQRESYWFFGGVCRPTSCNTSNGIDFKGYSINRILLRINEVSTEDFDFLIYDFDLLIYGEAEDTDGDGIADHEDDCPNSDRSPLVVLDGCNSGVTNTMFPSGCTIADLMAECAEGARNHGQFVSCVSPVTNDLKKAGTITGQQQGTIESCAAKAHIP